jgi:NAD(P)-dependent dehydrogenase (short-subunit alcohol dehydrogenase family)
MPTTWLITGCSTGIGRLLAESLLDLGENVVATARNVESIADIGAWAEERILRLKLDVTNALQIDEAVAEALDRFGAIDMLVNNAGYGYFATQEEAEIEEVRAMFETNVFGLIAMSRAVIPQMRARRSGTIINLSSMAGRMATPRGGFYQASKWAVEAISESQYLELSSFGVRVIVVEPGSYQTDFGPRSSRRSAGEDDPKSPYASLRTMWIANASRELFPYRQDPREVVSMILHAYQDEKPFARIPIGRDALNVVAQRDERGMDGFVEWMRGVYHNDEDL